MLFGLAKKKEEPMLLFHVGSSKVAGAFFVPQESGYPKIIFSIVEPIPVQEQLDPGKFFSYTLRTLQTVADKIHRQGLLAPKRIFVVLAAPWHSSQTRTIHLKKNAPFVFTEKIADELIKKEIQIFSAEHATQYPQNEHALRAIELRNIQTVLNGYEVAEPLYKKIQELEMTIFVSTSGEKLLGKIENAIRKAFHFEQIKFSSFAMAVFAMVRDLNQGSENFLLVDVGGEVTSIFLIKKGLLRESISYPLGHNFLVRGMVEALGSTPDEAVSLISLWKNGHAEKSVGKKIGDTMGKLRGEWLNKFQELLAHLSNDISIPGTIYMTAEGNFGDVFSEIIKTEQFSQYTLADSKFKITILDVPMLNTLTRFGGEVRDPSLLIDSLYINRFLINS